MCFSRSSWISNADASLNWTGVDADVCRAVAAAVLGDANKVVYTTKC